MESRAAYFDLVDEQESASASIGQFDMESVNGFGDAIGCSGGLVNAATRVTKTNSLLFDGHKGCVIKLLLILVVFSIGFLLGTFLLRKRAAQSVANLYQCGSIQTSNHYSPAVFQAAQEQVTSSFILAEMRAVTSAERRSGQPFQEHLASAIAGQWRQWGLDNVQLDKHVGRLYIMPKHGNLVRLVRRDSGQVLFIANSTSSAFNAYAKMVDMRVNFAYAHYGTREDFAILAQHNVSCEGRLLVMRIGRVSISSKIQQAKLVGAVGLLLYPDPVEFTRNNVNVSTNEAGWRLPEDATVSLFLTEADNFALQSISWADARELLRYLVGPVAPQTWIHEIVYRLGPAPDSIALHLLIRGKSTLGNITNVIGSLRGTEEPDRWVILSASYDSWLNGAAASGSATAIMQQIVRILGVESKLGWRPRRTLLFALWDAAEFGQLGLSKYVQTNSARLKASAVAWISLDSAPVQGIFGLTSRASLTLRKVLLDATKSVVNLPRIHDYDSSYSEVLDHSVVLDWMNDSSTDAAAALSLGIPVVRAQFAPQHSHLRHPISYHTRYDTVDDVLTHVDRNLTLHVKMARLTLDLALRLLDSRILPYSLDAVTQRLRAIDALLRWRKLATHVDKDIFLASLQRFKVSVDYFALAEAGFTQFTSNITFLSTSSWRSVRLLNDALRTVSLCFRSVLTPSAALLNVDSDLATSVLDTALTELLKFSKTGQAGRSNSTDADLFGYVDKLDGAVSQATRVLQTVLHDAASTS